MNTKKLMLAAAAAVTGATLTAAVPEVSGVTMTQANDRLVTITYTLANAPAVVTLDVQTNATANATSDDPGWTSIGGEAVWNAAGDVWKKVSTSAGTITWHPDHSWPDNKIADGCARAVVTAWALDNTPDYMVVDLTGATGGDTVRYYPGVEFLPKSSFNQTGAAVTNNPAYKTTKLLMRKIMARGVEWTMGSTTDETLQRGSSNREATHYVTLTNNYYIGVFEFTQRQWALVATNSAAKAYFQVNGDMRPMENFSYNELRNTHSTSSSATSVSAGTLRADPSTDSFLGLLRIRTSMDFDLPSEAQWEFAARAGHGAGYWSDGSKIQNIAQDTNLEKLGRFAANNPGGTTEQSGLAPEQGGTAIVGSYLPNDWGLYDVHGNVFEWCLDWFQNNIATTRASDDGNVYGGRVNISPTNLSKCLDGSTPGNGLRSRRGGSYRHNAGFARPASRENITPDTRGSPIGFRVVCTAGLK